MHKEVDNTEPWQEGLGVTHNDTQTDEAAGVAHSLCWSLGDEADTVITLFW